MHRQGNARRGKVRQGFARLSKARQMARQGRGYGKAEGKLKQRATQDKAMHGKTEDKAMQRAGRSA